MNARILTAATFATAFAVLPGKAADPQLLNLVMPDAVVIAGVNVEQAKTTPFGQYILSQFPTQDANFQKLEAKTGFDPTRDVREILMASTQSGVAGKNSGIVMARGSFDPSRIAAAAAEDGAVSEAYKGITILEDPKQENGVAFLNATLAIAGDVASVKGAIDRQSASTSLPAEVMVQISHWSGTQDAWAISTVPLSTLASAGPAQVMIPGLNGQGSGAFQSIQSAAGGVKFGDQVKITGEAKSDNATNAKTIADTIKLLASFAQLQAQNDPNAAAVLQSLQITSNGNTVNLSVSIAENTLQQFVKPRATNVPTKKPLRKM